MDITYIPMARGFVYLAAVVDWSTRRVLSWRVSTGMEVDFCLEAVEGSTGQIRSTGDFQEDRGIMHLHLSH
jgi:putative transposase